MFELIEDPFSTDPEVPLQLQLDIIELQTFSHKMKPEESSCQSICKIQCNENVQFYW